MKKSIAPQTFTERLAHHYSDEICHLNWDKARPWTLLFAVIMSAQCTDNMVNKVTANLFQDFPDLESYVARPIEELEMAIKSIGLYRTKAKNLKKCARQLILEHESQVPDTMEALVRLAGVGRKTANVILWNVFEKNLGFVVDTHVGRIAQRTGLTRKNTPEAIEKDLMKKLPQDLWGLTSHRLVQFGRDFCKSQKPKCDTCFFSDVCPQRNINTRPKS